MKNSIIMLLLILCFTQLGNAQFLYSTSNDTSLLSAKQDYLPDEALVKRLNPPKPLWIPVVESFGLNAFINLLDNYVGDMYWAKISFNSIKFNFERGWSTDSDRWNTNMWQHPFHGSMYYNFTRSSGYNYWTSLGISALGSWNWEFFMETESPSLNDWVMTTVAGSMFGEMFYRFSNLILDESLSGGARFWNELGAGVFNPGRLFNRLVYGQTARRIPEKLYEKRIYLGELGAGVSNVAEGTNLEEGDKNGIFTMDFTYGRIFEMREYKPFDFFRFHMLLNYAGDQPLFGQFRIYGVLHGQSSKVGENSRFVWGIFNHYDYLDNNVYEVGGVSVGLGAGYRTPKEKKVQFIGMVHGAVLLMGGANSDYSKEYEIAYQDSTRAYNLGPGAHAKIESILSFPFGSLFVGYSFWWIHTWDGAPGDELIGMLNPTLRFRLSAKWYAGLEYLFYHRSGLYDDLPDRNYRNNEQRLFVAYAF